MPQQATGESVLKHREYRRPGASFTLPFFFCAGSFLAPDLFKLVARIRTASADGHGSGPEPGVPSASTCLSAIGPIFMVTSAAKEILVEADLAISARQESARQERSQLDFFARRNLLVFSVSGHELTRPLFPPMTLGRPDRYDVPP